MLVTAEAELEVVAELLVGCKSRIQMGLIQRFVAEQMVHRTSRRPVADICPG